MGKNRNAGIGERVTPHWAKGTMTRLDEFDDMQNVMMNIDERLNLMEARIGMLSYDELLYIIATPLLTKLLSLPVRPQFNTIQF